MWTMKCAYADSCLRAKGDGACSLPEAAELCPVTCGLRCALSCILCACDPCHSISATCNCASAAQLPWTWCKKAVMFCVSSSQLCDQTAVCGDKVRSVEECKEAAIELLGPNITVTVLDHKKAPAGCFIKQTEAYFNIQTHAGSDYSFLKSLCRLRNISTVELPEAKSESISACGQNRTLPVYRIPAEDLEHTIDVLLHKTNIYQFVLLLKQGSTTLNQRLILSSGNSSARRLDIVIAGQTLQGQREMTEPPKVAELRTRVDLKQNSIFVVGGSDSAVCFQDLHLKNGKVPCDTLNPHEHSTIRSTHVACAGHNGWSSSSNWKSRRWRCRTLTYGRTVSYCSFLTSLLFKCSNIVLNKNEGFGTTRTNSKGFRATLRHTGVEQNRTLRAGLPLS